MRAYLKKEQGIIEIPEDFASLTRVDQDKSGNSFQYKFQYNVDPKKAFRNNAIIVEMFVSNKPFEPKTFNKLESSNAEDIITNIRIGNQIQKDLYRSDNPLKDNKKWVPHISSDITRFISNAQVTLFSSERNQAANITSPIVSTRTNYRPMLVSELESQDANMPILEVNTNTQTNKYKTGHTDTNSVELREKATELLFQKKIDPAAFVGSRSNSIISSKNSYEGSTTKINKSIKKDSFDDSEILITSLLSNTVNTDSNKNQNNYQSVPITETNIQIVVEETLSIPTNYLDAEEFYVVFRLINNVGLILQTESGLVNHAKLLSLRNIPCIPPVIITPPKSSTGGTTINLKQVDPSGTKIRLYRKNLTALEALRDATYSLVGEVKCSPGDGFVSMYDYVNSLHPVIYRAVSINSNGLMSSEFSSAVVEVSRGSIAKTVAINQKPNFISISSSVLPTSITVKLNNFPPDPIAFLLKRRNLSLKENTYTNISSVILLDVLQSSDLVIEDTFDLKPKHIYEYSVFFIYKTGETKQSTSRHVVEFTPITNNVVSLSVTPAEIEQTGGGEIDIKFSIEKNINLNDADQVKLFLTKQGFLGEFQEDIIENREKLGNLFAIGVTRQNLSTGQVEDFGILEDDENFSDLLVRAATGVESLISGNEYKYTITAYARNIESLLPKLARTDSSNENLPYTYTPADWIHPITLENGNIVTETSLKRNHAYKTFTFGNIVDIKEVQVSLSDTLPFLYDGKATYFSNGESVLIQWKVQGNVNKIDHFIIVLDVLGMKTIVGKAHNVSSTNYFQFVDNLSNKESGGLTYFIVPVYYDYSRGVEFKTNQVVV